MSTIALKMPANYVDVAEDEMMYLEGGWRTVSHSYYGTGLRLTGTEVNTWNNNNAWAAGPIAAAFGIIHSYAAFIAATVMAIYGGTINNMNSNNSGITLYWLPGGGLPLAIDNY